MRASESAHALEQLTRTVQRLSWPVKALTAMVVALVLGFLIGGAAVGPVLSSHSPDNPEAVQTRFERRSVDPNGHYPEPSPYRAQSPDFGPHQGPAAGALAKKQAQREQRGRGVAAESLSGEAPAERLSVEASESFGAAPQQPPAPYRTRDRHTGTSY